MPESKKSFYPSIALMTDFYEITMAYAYWKNGMQDSHALFQMFFRSNPMQGGYSIFAGMGTLSEMLEAFRFLPPDIEYLGGLKDEKGKPFFEAAFLDYLSEMKFSCDIAALEEGRIAFPNEPLIRVAGPIIQAQLLESLLLNVINFQTLIATKASRVCEAAKGAPVLEFGLRRAQGVDGALSASRAAYIGGCASTSNVLAGRMLGIPVKGTHAHSWVMAFDSEKEAFAAYAKAMPDNCILLVDTYDSLQGVKNAIEVAKDLKKKGFAIKGIRLDSGDLAYLSVKARELLDRAGFPECRIVASSSLDEDIINSLHDQGAKVDIWGVGTKLVVGFPDAALDGIYKLSAVEKKGQWQYRMKISEKLSKVSIPGMPLLRRYYNEEGIVEADLIYDESEEERDFSCVRDPFNPGRKKTLKEIYSHEELLKPVFENGARVGESEPLSAIRERVKQELQRLHPGHRRFINPHEYPVGVSERLFKIREELINKIQNSK